MNDKKFFSFLYWVILICGMMIVLSITADIKGGDTDFYFKAQRINNGH